MGPNLGPDTQKHLSSTYLSAVHVSDVTAVKTTYFIEYLNADLAKIPEIAGAEF